MRSEDFLNELVENLAVRLAERLRPDLQGGAQGVRKRLLSVDEAAVYLGRSVHAVRHLIASGKLRPVKIDERVFLDVQDLDGLIEASK